MIFHRQGQAALASAFSGEAGMEQGCDIRATLGGDLKKHDGFRADFAGSVLNAPLS